MRPNALLRCSSSRRAGCSDSRVRAFCTSARDAPAPRTKAIGPAPWRHRVRAPGRLEGHTETMKLRKSIVTLSAVAAVAAAFAAPATAHTYQHSTPYRGDVETPGNLQSIAQCESGGDPSAIGGGGTFRRKYQVIESPWDNVAPHGYAGADQASAPESVQDEAAQSLLSQSGTSPWPVCGA